MDSLFVKIELILDLCICPRKITLDDRMYNEK